jgi:hypothetical protein
MYQRYLSFDGGLAQPSQSNRKDQEISYLGGSLDWDWFWDRFLSDC